MNDAIKLIGIVIVVIGFVMKFDTLATVVVAGLVTGLISGMSIMDILNTRDFDSCRASDFKKR